MASSLEHEGAGQSEQGRWAFDLNPSGERSVSDLLVWLQVSPEIVLRQVPGRETFVAPADHELRSKAGEAEPGAPCRDWVIKRFEGPLTGERWYSRWWNPDRRSPGQREYDSLIWLQARGLPVPRAVGWARAGRASLVVMEYVEHTSDLRSALGERPALWAQVRVPLRRWVHSLHSDQAGEQAVHRDLYLQHFLISEAPFQGCLIDVGRLLIGQPLRRRWIEKDLAALAHSCPASISDRQRLAWLGSYLRARKPGLSRSAHRRELWAWAGRIEGRRKRMAAHRPRFGEEPLRGDDPR